MKKVFVAIFAMAALFTFTSVASAGTCVQSHSIVKMVGVDHSDGRIYVNFSDYQAGGCNCGSVRFLPGNTNTEEILSVLMGAKLSGNPVRIDLLDSNSCNTGYRAYIE